MDAVFDLVSVVSIGAPQRITIFFRTKSMVGFLLRSLRVAAAMKLIPITFLKFLYSGACLPLPLFMFSGPLWPPRLLSFHG